MPLEVAGVGDLDFLLLDELKERVVLAWPVLARQAVVDVEAQDDESSALGIDHHEDSLLCVGCDEAELLEHLDPMLSP
eukprot:801668-Rhodomonas_salina.1